MDSTEVQILKSFLNMPEHDLTTYEDESITTYIFIAMHQVHNINPMKFCLDSWSPHSFIGDKALERIFGQSGSKSFPIIDSRRDFKFRDTLFKSRGMVELMLPRTESTLDIPVLLDFVDVKMPALVGLDVHDCNNFFVDNVTNHLWNIIVTNKDPLRI